MKFLHVLQGQGSGLHYLILLIKEASVSQFFNSVGIKLHIIRPKYQSEFDPLSTVLLCGITKSGCERKL